MSLYAFQQRPKVISCSNVEEVPDYSELTNKKGNTKVWYKNKNSYYWQQEIRWKAINSTNRWLLSVICVLSSAFRAAGKDNGLNPSIRPSKTHQFSAWHKIFIHSRIMLLDVIFRLYRAGSSNRFEDLYGGMRIGPFFQYCNNYISSVL